MSYDPGKGALFKNAQKLSDEQPDYRGEAKIDCKPHWINGWVQTAKSGTRYVSLSIKLKAEAVPQRKSADARTNQDDEIGF